MRPSKSSTSGSAPVCGRMAASRRGLRPISSVSGARSTGACGRGLARPESSKADPGRWARPIGPWFAQLCALEEQGWKGRRGSAIGSDKDLSACLAEALDRLAAAGQLRFWSINLDGRAIASLFAIVSADRAWLGKIAFDEAFVEIFAGRICKSSTRRNRSSPKAAIGARQFLRDPGSSDDQQYLARPHCHGRRADRHPQHAIGAVQGDVGRGAASGGARAAPPRMSTTVSSGGRNREHRDVGCAHRARKISQSTFRIEAWACRQSAIFARSPGAIGAIDASRPHRV